MSNANSIKIARDDIAYYVVDPSQSVQALNNYHKNKRIDKFLELSKTEEVTLDKITYKRTEYLSEIQFRQLYNIQRDIEKISSRLTITNMNAVSVSKRLETHGQNMKATEMTTWTNVWTKLNKEYDDIVMELEKKTEESRVITLQACFNITKEVYHQYFSKLLDLADGCFMAIIGMYDVNDSARVKDVIGPLVNPDYIDTMVATRDEKVKAVTDLTQGLKDKISSK